MKRYKQISTVDVFTGVVPKKKYFLFYFFEFTVRSGAPTPGKNHAPQLSPRGNVHAYSDQDILGNTGGGGEGVCCPTRCGIYLCRQLKDWDVLWRSITLSNCSSTRLNTCSCASCNKLLRNSMNDGGRSMGPAAAIVDDCYHLACDFPNTNFVLCFREWNEVAHELA